MAIYSNGTLVIDNSGNIIPSKYSARTSLPTAAQGYIAYATDTNDFVFGTNRNPATGPFGNLYPQQTTGGDQPYYRWYKFLNKPADYKNELILQQGSVAGGYVGGSVWSQILRVNSVTNIAQEQPQTMPFASYYGAWHSSEWYAYHHQGNSSVAACKQDWATWSIVGLNNRPTGSYSPNPWHNGTKAGANNNYGMIQIGGTGNYINFNNDTWAVGYATGGSHSYGNGGPQEGNTAFNWTAGQGGAYIFNYTTMTSSGGYGGEAPNIGGGTAGKPLSSKWYKWYANPNASSIVTKYNVSSNSWTVVPNQNYNNGENCPVMAQDWGYWICGYNGAQNNVSVMTFYQSDSTFICGTVYGQRNQSSGNGCWGIIP
jgi:hypothetical protein